ncbi:MAG TPA: ABC transporter substrate-binding protein [Stellaceae bacterium]|nr:ABC transporter substrate-binding protein [Stellaceae bacterium]
MDGRAPASGTLTRPTTPIRRATALFSHHLRVLWLLVAFAFGLGSAAHAAELQQVHYGFGDKAVSPVLINLLVPQYLGYYQQEGLTVDFVPLGANAAVLAALDSKRIEFGTGVAAFQLPKLAVGDRMPSVNVFEYIYPFKFAMAVNQDSPVKTFADLKGKRIGVSHFGNAEYAIARHLLQQVHVDPDKDVKWLAVGEGVNSAIALQRGDIDSLMYYDTAFGLIEAAGFKLRYLPLPPNFPRIGGTFISVRKDILADHRAWAVGFARAVLKGETFILQNPRAAAYIFLKMYPEAAPRNMTLDQQINAILALITKHIALFRPYDASMKWGYIRPADWQDEIDFYNVKGIKDGAKSLFTNELIDEINNFNRDEIVKQAKTFKIPTSQ